MLSAVACIEGRIVRSDKGNTRLAKGVKIARACPCYRPVVDSVHRLYFAKSLFGSKFNCIHSLSPFYKMNPRSVTFYNFIIANTSSKMHNK
jgi:predicted N-formylglutamate amidohydrolase